MLHYYNLEIKTKEDIMQREKESEKKKIVSGEENSKEKYLETNEQKINKGFVPLSPCDPNKFESIQKSTRN